MKISRNMIFILLMMSISFYLGCGNADKEDTVGKSKTSVEDIKKEATETVDKALTYLEQKKKKFQGQIEEKIEQLGPKIEALKEKTKGLTDDAGVEMDHQIQKLEKLKDNLKGKLTELNKKGADSWEKSKKEFLKEWEELKKSYDRIVNKK